MPPSFPTRFINSLSVHVSSHSDETDCWHSTEAEVFDADGSLDTRQSPLTRRFVHARLEKAFVRRTFPLGRACVRIMLCFSMMYEVGLLVHALACQCGIRWELAGHWYLRLFTMGTPFPLSALGLAFTYSHRCTPRTLPYAAVFVTLALALVILIPNSVAAGELAQEIVVSANGVVQNTKIGVLEDFKKLLLQHTVVEFGVALVGTLIFDAAGLSPPAMILLHVACITLHVSLSGPVFSARFSPMLSVAHAWWHPAISVIGIQIVQVYVVSALKRRVFLVQLLTAAHRIEQLSREKERAEWQQLLQAATQQRHVTGQGSDPGEREPVRTVHFAHEIDVGIDEPKSLAAAVESMASRAAALPRILSASSGPSNASDSEIVSHINKPKAGANDTSAGAASTAPPRASGSPGLVALRQELLAARREIQARKAATQVAIVASPPSVATSATAAELQCAFETEQREPRGTIAETSRPKTGRSHPLRAFVMALYGQRPPGPMPGEMPTTTAEAGDDPLSEP